MRNKKHDRYYAIQAYQILAKMTDKDVAKILGISLRTYKDKISGYSDFTSAQGKKLSQIFGVSQDEIFLT